jgi:hypothetical protein
MLNKEPINTGAAISESQRGKKSTGCTGHAPYPFHRLRFVKECDERTAMLMTVPLFEFLQPNEI